MSPPSNPHSTSPRLPSPPPFTEVQISQVPLSLSLSKSPVRQISNSITRRIRPGTKSRHIALGPPLVPLSELESAFQLQEHLASLLSATTSPPGSETTVPLSRDACESLADPPDGVEEYLWCYELTRRLTRDLNVLLVALLNDNCTASSCPEMRASEWQYLCAVHDPPQSCCAIDYSTHTLDQAATMLCTTRYFPSRLSLHNGSIKHLGSIFRRLYRIFAHAWFQHRGVFWEVESEFGLYLFFKTVSDRYNLIPEDNLTLPPEAEGLKSKNFPEGTDSDEEEVDEFDRGTGSRGHRQELDEDEDYPDSDESESDEEEEEEEEEEGEDEDEDEDEEEGEGEGANQGDGEGDDDEFDLDADDHLMDAEVGESGIEVGDLLNGKSGGTRDKVENNLLLLPSPRSYSVASLKEAYTPAFTAAFQHAPRESPSTLDIAIHIPFISGKTPRGRLFDKTQRLLARLYSILNSVAATKEGEVLVDPRIVFLSDAGQASTDDSQSGIGPVMGLRELATSEREWKNITIASSSPASSGAAEEDEPEGKAMGKAFLMYRRDKFGPDVLPFQHDVGIGSGCEVSEVGGPDADGGIHDVSAEHLIVAVGGTFDHIHLGHKLLLTMTAFLLSPDAAAPRLVVGITGGTLLINKKHSQLLGAWDHRAIDVIEFLRGISDFSSSSASPLPRVSHASSIPRTPLTPQSFTATISGQHNKILIIEAVEINDPFGPTITNEAITALVVSQETNSGGEAVNKRRTEKGWDPLQVFLVDVIEEEGGGKMSSTEIRRKLEEKQKEEPRV